MLAREAYQGNSNMTSTGYTNGVAKDFGEMQRLSIRIQHTLISNVLTEALWESHIAECLKYKFHAAMLPGAWVKKTAERLRGTGIRTASFIDFPYGTMTSAGKAVKPGISSTLVRKRSI